jgi:hypothetical protein
VEHEPAHAFYEETVALLVKEALYLADGQEHQRLLERIQDIFDGLLETYQQLLATQAVHLKTPSPSEVSAACEHVLVRTSIFIRALLGFSERMAPHPIRSTARLFGWQELIRPETMDAVLLHTAAVVQIGVLSLSIASLAGQA